LIPAKALEMSAGFDLRLEHPASGCVIESRLERVRGEGGGPMLA
jgi:hypothetical protein